MRDRSPTEGWCKQYLRSMLAGRLHMGHLFPCEGSASAQVMHMHMCLQGYTTTSFSSVRQMTHSGVSVSSAWSGGGVVGAATAPSSAEARMLSSVVK